MVLACSSRPPLPKVTMIVFQLIPEPLPENTVPRLSVVRRTFSRYLFLQWVLPALAGYTWLGDSLNLAASACLFNSNRLNP